MKFRDLIPSRNCKKKYKHYRSYKPYLIIDFNNRCGYCDDWDAWLGGFNFYHIDHFAPRKLFSHLAHDYDNLIYSCPYCNSSKSDKWPTLNPEINVYQNKGFLNPISEDFNSAFERDDDGRIVPLTDVAKYMYRELNLNLIRHEIIWSLTRLTKLIDEIDNIRPSIKDQNQKKNLKNLHYKLLQIFHFYIKQLHLQNSK